MYASAEERRAYTREYERETRKFWKSRSRCVECGDKDAYTISGRALCAECVNKRKLRRQREKTDAEKKKERERKESRRITLEAERRCTGCGKPLADNDTHKRCPTCRAYGKKKATEYREKQGKTPRVLYEELGVCMKCGKPRATGIETQRGEPVKMCADCYRDACLALQKGRDAYREKYGIDFVRQVRKDIWKRIEYRRIRA